MNILQYKLSEKRALELLREIAKDSRNVKFTEHALSRMRQRRITNAQVISCLEKGTINEPPVMDLKGRWKLTVERVSCGEHIGVAVSIDNDAVVITAFHIRR